MSSVPVPRPWRASQTRAPSAGKLALLAPACSHLPACTEDRRLSTARTTGSALPPLSLFSLRCHTTTSKRTREDDAGGPSSLCCSRSGLNRCSWPAGSLLPPHASARCGAMPPARAPRLSPARSTRCARSTPAAIADHLTQSRPVAPRCMSPPTRRPPRRRGGGPPPTPVRALPRGPARGEARRGAMIDARAFASAAAPQPRAESAWGCPPARTRGGPRGPLASHPSTLPAHARPGHSSAPRAHLGTPMPQLVCLASSSQLQRRPPPRTPRLECGGGAHAGLVAPRHGRLSWIGLCVMTTRCGGASHPRHCGGTPIPAGASLDVAARRAGCAAGTMQRVFA